MKKVFLLYLLFIATTVGFTQRANNNFFIKGGVGALQYYGDLSNKFINIKESTLGYHIGVGFQPNKVLGIELNYLRGTVKGNDRADAWLIKNNPSKNENYNRSLNFKTDINDLNIKLLINFDNGKLISKYAVVAPYLTVGFGIGKFNTYGNLLNGSNRYYYWNDGTIRDIDENDANAINAQIIEQDNSYETNLADLNIAKDYKQFKMQTSLGFGLNFKLTKFMYLYMQTEWIYNFTDYIDDVSNDRITVTGNSFIDYAANPAGVITDTRSNNNNKIGDSYLHTNIGLVFYFGKKKNDYITINTKHLYNDTYGYKAPKFLNDTLNLTIQKDSLIATDTLALVTDDLTKLQITNNNKIQNTFVANNTSFITLYDTITLSNNKKIITKKTIYTEYDTINNYTIDSLTSIQEVDSMINALDSTITKFQNGIDAISPTLNIQNDSIVWIQIANDSSTIDYLPISGTLLQNDTKFSNNIAYLKNQDTTKINTLDSLKVLYNQLLQLKTSSLKDTITTIPNTIINDTVLKSSSKKIIIDTSFITIKDTNNTIPIYKMDTIITTKPYVEPNTNFINKLDSLKNELNLLDNNSNNKKSKKNKKQATTTSYNYINKTGNNIIDTVNTNMPTTTYIVDTINTIQYNTPFINNTFPNKTTTITPSNYDIQTLQQNDVALNQKLNEIYTLLQQQNLKTTITTATIPSNFNNSVPSNNYTSNTPLNANTIPNNINNNILKDSIVLLQQQMQALQQYNLEQQNQLAKQIKSMQKSDSLMFELLQANSATTNNPKKVTDDVKIQNQALLNNINDLLQQYKIKSIDTTALNNQQQVATLKDELNQVKTELQSLQTKNQEANNKVNPNKETLVLSIYFDVNKTNIDKKYVQELNDIVNLLQQNTKLNLMLKGYTDASGNAAYNKKLSVERTQSVKDFFILLNGINYYRIKELGLGEDFANIAGDSQYNRRVDIYVIGNF